MVLSHLHHIIVLVGTSDCSGHEIRPLGSGYSVARQRHYPSYEKPFNAFGGIVEGYDIATPRHDTSKPSIAEEPVYLACPESIAPAVDHYPVTALEIGFKSGTPYSVYCQGQCPESEEGYCRHGDGNNGLLQSLLSTFNVLRRTFNLLNVVNETEYPAPTYAGESVAVRIARPPDENRLAYDMVFRHEAPIA